MTADDRPMTVHPQRSPIAPGLVIGTGVEVGERVSFGAHVVIHDNVVIGDDCTVQDGAVLGKPPQLGRHSHAPATSPERLVIESGATICCYAIVCWGARVGADAVIGDHVFLREHAEIGQETVIGHGAAIGRGVRIGARVRLQNSVIVAPESLIEDDVFFGPLVAVTNDQTLGRREATGVRLEGAVARRGCRVGANAVLLPGVEIGVEAIVAAGSVVTRSVPDRMVAMGAPARVTRSVDPRELPPVAPGPA
jgi:UDP-2-acetamido-3-amino-2,3-dideoxy-glucuronate N-acetyltransferase